MPTVRRIQFFSSCKRDSILSRELNYDKCSLNIKFCSQKNNQLMTKILNKQLKIFH